MRLKSNILVLSLAFLLAAPAAATTYPWASVSTIPATPVPGDTVFLALSGEWNDTCVPTSSLASLHKNGYALRVHLNYSGFSGACGSAITPWQLEVEAGVLAEGKYTVEVTVSRSFLPNETIGTGGFAIVAPPVTRLWIPAFSAQSDGYTLASNLTAFNTANSTAVVTPLHSYDALGERPPSTDPVQIAPGTAALVPTQNLRPDQAVEMLELAAPGRLAFRATLERLELVPEALPKVPESLGRVELPVFTSLFPAGMTVVAGDISLTPSECAGAAERRRRINLTLFNSGSEPATFLVIGEAVGPGPGGGADPITFNVPARSLVQFNELPVQAFPVCDPGGAWFRITGDQPFLAYVSTVRPQTVPGILPYEIFPARVDR